MNNKEFYKLAEERGLALDFMSLFAFYNYEIGFFICPGTREKAEEFVELAREKLGEAAADSFLSLRATREDIIIKNLVSWHMVNETMLADPERWISLAEYLSW